MDRFRGLGIVAVAVIAIVWFVCPSSRIGSSVARDFSAFYCSGAVVATGQDPYRAGPIGDCERAPKKYGLFSVPAGVTLPAPLPPYDILGFSLLGRLPYEIATPIWLLSILAAFIVTIEAMRSVTELPRWVLWLVFAPIDGLSAIHLGEVAPLAVASLALSMLALRHDRPKLAATALILSLCEPHVGIAPILALFVCVPRTRPTIVLGGAVLGVLSLFAGGFARSMEYFRDVLPAHAVSEITSTRQLSLTALLHSAGLGDGAALAFGSLSYLAMLTVGILTARHLARRNPFDPMIVAAPSAFVLLGGVFIHIIQMPAAFPAALLAYTQTRGRLRAVVGSALIVLCVPWLGFLSHPIIVPCIGFLVTLLALRLLAVSPAVAIAAGATAACFVYGVELGMAFGDTFPGAMSLSPIKPNDLAEINWGENIRAVSRIDSGPFTVVRLPDWIAMTTIAVSIGVASWTQDRIAGLDRSLFGFGVASTSTEG